MEWKHGWKASWIVLLGVVLLFGCSNDKEAAEQVPAVSGEQQGEAPTKAPEPEVQPPKPAPMPVTIKMGMSDSFFTPEEFEQYVLKPVQGKYPHITIERVNQGVGTSALEQMIVAEAFPDLILASATDRFVRLELTLDIEPYIKEAGIDLGKIQQALLQQTRVAGMSDKLAFLPINQAYPMMVYNKGLFDRFGVPYPKDGLTYDDMTDLAKLMTRHSDGIQYRGFEPSGLTPLGALSVRPVNPTTNKMDLSGSGYRIGFELLRSIYTIPGNGEAAFGSADQYKQFITEQRLAVLLATGSILGPIGQANNQLDWDIAQYPSFKEKPNVRVFGGMNYAIPLPASKEKLAVVQVIDAMLSDAPQLEASRQGKPTILNNPEIDKQFGVQVPLLQGKNVAALFKGTVAPPPEGAATLYDSLPRTTILNKLMEVVTTAKDINTALREAEEEGNKIIQEQMSQ